MNMDDETISAGGLRRDAMLEPDEVTAMLRLRKLGWGSKRLAREFGCSRTTVKRYLASCRWQPYQRRASRGMLAGHETWLRERFFRHRGNADVVRQDLAREHGIVASLRTVERAVSGFRQQLAAEARATMRFETPPGHQLQIDFGEKRVCIGGDTVRIYPGLFVTVVALAVGVFRRQPVCDQDEGWRCVYFTADVR